MERKRAGAGRGRGAETGSEMRGLGKTRWERGRSERRREPKARMEASGGSSGVAEKST